MAATIQTILKPTRARGLDTSGNNNHAQIYSGRALEFDGITDYLECFTTLDTTHAFLKYSNDFTIALWLKVTNLGDDTVFYATTTANDRLGLNIGAEGEIAFTTYSTDSTAYTHASGGGSNEKIINTSTWYRVVCTCSNNTLKLYLNGILQTGTTTAHSGNLGSTNSNRLRIGERNSIYFDGCLSDFQVWNSVFSQDDVTYDYLNPEQLALNRGGTSLTNSNLKLWYPMNEGHRGNQSYVLDASNTGLGDNVVLNGTFDTDLSQWTVINNTGDNDVTWVDGKARLLYDPAIATSSLGISSSGHQPMTTGVDYKVTFDLVATSGELKFYNHGTTHATGLGTGSHTMYFNADGADIKFFRNSSGQATDVTIDNVKIYPINAKNNATTAFYGDEQITATVNRDFSGSSNWGNYGSSSTAPSISGGKLVCVTDGDGGNEGAQLALSFIDGAGGAHPIVIGRTYRISAKLDNTAGKTTPDINFSFGGYAANIVRASDGNTGGTIDTTEQEYYADITAINSSALLIYQATADNNATTTFTIDDVSVKEVGTAMGWTDADQQLDIPQTALQSYNQLAMFNTNDIGGTGENTYVAFSDGDSVHNVTTANHSWSFWYMPDIANDTGYLVQKGGHNASGWYIFLTNGAVQYQTNQSSANQANTVGSDLTVGVWSHVVVAVSDSGTDSNIYVNGELVSSKTNHIAPATHTSNMNFMSYQGTTNPLNGCITEISAWSSTLSATEVTELYNEGLALDATTHSGSSNLKGYWRNNGLSQWDDLSSNSINGTPTNITETMLITAGVDSSRDSQGFLMNRQRLTNSLNLPLFGEDDPTVDDNASTNYADVETVINDDVFSVSCWFKPSHSGETQQLVCNRDSGDEGWVLMSDSSNNIEFKIGDGTDTVTVDTGANITVGTWVHIAVTYAGSAGAIKTYINGAATATGTATNVGNMSSISSTMRIGARSFTSPMNGVQGEVDDVLYYDDVLEATEVLRNYNAGKRSHR